MEQNVRKITVYLCFLRVAVVRRDERESVAFVYNRVMKEVNILQIKVPYGGWLVSSCIQSAALTMAPKMQSESACFENVRFTKMQQREDGERDKEGKTVINTHKSSYLR